MSTLVRIQYAGMVEGEIDANPDDPDAWAEAISDLWAELGPECAEGQLEAEMIGYEIGEPCTTLLLGTEGELDFLSECGALQCKEHSPND